MDTVLLYSGGLDSFVSAGLLLEEDPGRELTCLFFDYDHHTVEVEWEASCLCIATLRERFPEATVLLVRKHLADYKDYVKDVALVGGGHIPTADEDSKLYFIPGRNILFLLYAAIYSYNAGCRQFAYSPHQWAHAGDCLPQFIEAIQEAFCWGFSMEKKKEDYKVWSPIGHLDKPGVVTEGTRLGLPLEVSWSCHGAGEKQCGICHNCVERKLSYKLAGIADGTVYADNSIPEG